MNIAMFQTMSATKMPTGSNSVQASTTDSKAFGSVFQSIMSTSNQSVGQQAPADQSLAETVTSILETDSLQSLLQQLGIETDESGTFVFVGEEGLPMAIDEMLTLEKLTELLGMSEQQLTSIIEQLLGDAKQEITDIWSVIEQAPHILSEVVAALQGSQQHNNVQPKELQQIVQFLKLAQLAGNKVDTVYQQEVQLSQLKDALLALANEAQKTVDTEQSTTKTNTFQQVIQQVVQQTSQQNGQQQSQQNQQAQQTSVKIVAEVQPTAQMQQQPTVKIETETQPTAQMQQQPTVKIETETQPTAQLQQQATQTKTVTITLPAEKPAQSDALLKEIQNLINRSQISGQQGNMKLFLKLFPENLGQIRIELVQKDGVLTARLLATTAIGKELLENNLNQLKAGFVAQNIQMERIDVAQSLQDADRNTRDQSFFNNFFGQQKEEEVEEQEDDNEDDKVSFKDLLSEEVE